MADKPTIQEITQIRLSLMTKPIVWIGDLTDDCTAAWAGLRLRAEMMDEGRWWWAVTETLHLGIELDSSNEYKKSPTSGEEARELAEAAARKYINDATRGFLLK